MGSDKVELGMNELTNGRRRVAVPVLDPLSHSDNLMHIYITYNSLLDM